MRESAFVLWEIAILLKVRRLSLREPYDAWATRLVTHREFALAAVDIAMLTTAYTYSFPHPFDSVITATAHVLDVPLITNDTASIPRRWLMSIGEELSEGGKLIDRCSGVAGLQLRWHASPFVKR